MRSLYASLAGLKLLTFSSPPTSASQNAGIAGMSHCTQPSLFVNYAFSFRGGRDFLYLVFYSSFISQFKLLTSDAIPGSSGMIASLSQCVILPLVVLMSESLQKPENVSERSVWSDFVSFLPQQLAPNSSLLINIC